MKVELNETKVRMLTTSLRAAHHDGHLTHSKVLEVVSAALGFRNWDTFCGMLKRESGPRLTLTKPVSLFVEVFATGDGDGPNWTQVNIDQALVNELLSLQALVVERKLAHVATFGEPTLWQGDHRDETDAWAVSFESVQLYVAARGWWFHAVPKHSAYACETRVVAFEDLKAALTGKASTPYLVRYASSVSGEPDVLVASSTGTTLSFLRELVADEALGSQYLP